MEKIEKLEDRNHLIHTHNTNSTSCIGENECNFVKSANSDDGTLRGDDEFCYEEDDFEDYEEIIIVDEPKPIIQGCKMIHK